MNEVIFEAVDRCEEYADKLFEEPVYFTQVTKWQDGDFRVLIWHGIDYEQEPYRQEAEQITYVHEDDGWIRYARVTRKIDHHVNEYNDQEELERLHKRT